MIVITTLSTYSGQISPQAMTNYVKFNVNNTTHVVYMQLKRDKYNW